MTEEVVKQLGNYRLTNLLGQGGFAKVYLGEHIYLQMNAAVKVLQARVSGPDDMDSFLKEARIVASLTHSHIVRVLDFGFNGETPFLVMDYAPNGTLRQRHPKGTRLALSAIVSYIKQVADALQYAHDHRLIHRDIKPENLLLGQRNEILLSDFGIALVTQSSQYHSTQGVVGTVPYMSPEHIQGKARPASDQYSLGIVVYEWLSGDRPFHGSFVELCTQHLFSPIPPLGEKVPTILPEVEQVVLKALAKDPKQRFDSVQAFADALEQASQLVPKIVVPLSLPLPNDASIPSLASTPVPESSPLSDAFPFNLPGSSQEQIVTKTFEKEFKEHLEILRAIADSSEQTSEAIPKLIAPLSPSPSEDASMSLPASIPFTEGSLLSHASLLNQQKSSKEQVGRQISQERRIAPNRADTTTLNLLERARKRGASLGGVVPNSANMTLNARSVGQRKIILMILGTAIASILGYCDDQLAIHNSILASSSIGNLPYFPSYGDLLFFGLAFLPIVLFLGAKFGPWAGSICALIGNLSPDLLTSHVSPWYWYVSFTFIGFISGLTPLKTYGRYNTKGAISIAVFISFFGMLMGNFFFASIDFIANQFTISSFSWDFISLMLNGIGSLIPFIILLIVDERFISRREQKAR